MTFGHDRETVPSSSEGETGHGPQARKGMSVVLIDRQLQQVESSHPSVTYEYLGDEELLQAQQKAVVFCNQNSVRPRPARITGGSSGGSNNVILECDPNLPAAAPPQEAVGPDLTYSYRTDQELLDATRSAQAYCMDNRWQQAVPSIRTNTDGSRVVEIACGCEINAYFPADLKNGL